MMEDYAVNPDTLPVKINRDTGKYMANGNKSISWTAVHTWSEFKNPAHPENSEEWAARVLLVK